MKERIRFWLSADNNYSIVEKSDGEFEIYYRRYSELRNHYKEWFWSYGAARNHLKKEYGLNTRMKQVSEYEWKSSITA